MHITSSTVITTKNPDRAALTSAVWVIGHLPMRGLPDHPRGGAGPKGAPSPAILGSQPYARSPRRRRAFTGLRRLPPALPCLTGPADPAAIWWCTARHWAAGRRGTSPGASAEVSAGDYRHFKGRLHGV